MTTQTKKNILHGIVLSLQVFLVLPFVCSAAWYLYTGETIWAFTDSDWKSATAFSVLFSGLLTGAHGFIYEVL